MREIDPRSKFGAESDIMRFAVEEVGEIKIWSERFLLRPLKISDVTPQYVGWLQNVESAKYIIKKSLTKEETQNYVVERLDRDDVLFLGIFERISGAHIGNIKFEPIDSKLRYALMGILIGGASWRGKRVASEVILSSAKWLKIHRNITKIFLGVDERNRAAKTAFERISFVDDITSEQPVVLPNGTKMVLHLDP